MDKRWIKLLIIDIRDAAQAGSAEQFSQCGGRPPLLKCSWWGGVGDFKMVYSYLQLINHFLLLV